MIDHLSSLHKARGDGRGRKKGGGEERRGKGRGGEEKGGEGREEGRDPTVKVKGRQELQNR